jgi:hypothetical protein
MPGEISGGIFWKEDVHQKGLRTPAPKHLESLVQAGLNRRQVHCLTDLLPKACRRLLFTGDPIVSLSPSRQVRYSPAGYTVSMLSTAYTTEGIWTQVKSRLLDDGMDIPNFGEASSIIDQVCRTFLSFGSVICALQSTDQCMSPAY